MAAQEHTLFDHVSGDCTKGEHGPQYLEDAIGDVHCERCNANMMDDDEIEPSSVAWTYPAILFGFALAMLISIGNFFR